MTKRQPCPPAPGPLEAYAAQFDPLLGPAVLPVGVALGPRGGQPAPP